MSDVIIARPRRWPVAEIGRAVLPLVALAMTPLALLWVTGLMPGIELDQNATTAGLLVGSLVGLTGMGSGALMTPILILVVGVPPVTAVGTDLAYASLTKIVGGWQHARQQTVDWRLVRLLAAGSVPASLASVQLLEQLERRVDIAAVDAIVRRGLGGVLILAAAALLLGALRARRAATSAAAAFPARRVVVLGAVVGSLVGLTSVGSGSLVVALLSLSSPLAATTIVGTDIAHAAILTSAAAGAHGLAGNIEPPLLASLLAGSLPGVLLGSRLSVRIPATALRLVLAVVLLATAGALL
jgi:uncharacterized membrane protein YfcA